MIDFYNQKIALEKMTEDLHTIMVAMKINELKAEKKELEEEQAKPDFWQNTARNQEVNKRLTSIGKKIKKFDDLSREVEDLKGILELIEELGEESEQDKAKKDVNDLSAKIDEFSTEALLKGKYDYCNAILTLHAGAGGTEAQDWVSMLYRMYSRYAERNDFKVAIIDRLDGDDAGIKSITISVNGENAYGFLKSEMGVHRLVRISPFDANSRRHTSFASMEVMPEITDTDAVTINPDDIRIDKFHSSGAGGQNVNKVESAIRITHFPTGIVVQCQNERSQIQNKEMAMKILLGKLAKIQEEKQIEEAQALKGEVKKIEWGSQIRSYVFCPYTLVKDHRTNFEKTDIGAVMDGDIGDFITEYLKKMAL